MQHSYTYISEGDIPGSSDAEGFPVGNVSSGIFFFTLYAMFDGLLQHFRNTMVIMRRPIVHFISHTYPALLPR